MALDTAAFSALVEESFRIKDEIEAIEKAEIDPRKKRLSEIDGIILAELDELQVNSFKSKAGLVMKRREYNVTVPKTREDKQALLGWLREKGDDVYYHYVGVNYQSLNSIWREEFEAAKEKGDFDFAIPGVGEPTVRDSIARRKK